MNKTKLKRWILLDSKTEYTTKFFNVEKRIYKLPNNKIIDDYYHINRPDFVLVIAINSKNEILVEKTYRRAVDDFVIEIPAGYIDDNEKPVEAGLRELREETGYTGTAMILGEIYIQPGYIKQSAYVIFVKVDEDKKVNTQLEDDEDIELEFMSWEDVNKMILNNEIKDMGMLSALAMYDRMKNTL